MCSKSVRVRDYVVKCHWRELNARSGAGGSQDVRDWLDEHVSHDIAANDRILYSVLLCSLIARTRAASPTAVAVFFFC